MRELSIALQPVDRLERVHVRGLRVVERDAALTVASIASDALRHEGVESAAELVVQVLKVAQRVENAVIAVGLPHRLASILVAFHAILGLVGAFRLPVELSDADQVEGVCEEL